MGIWSALLSGALERGRIWSRTGSRCSGSPGLLWRMSWHRIKGWIHDQPDLTVSQGQERVSVRIKRAAKSREDYPLLLERDNRRERRRHRGEMWRNARLLHEVEGNHEWPIPFNLPPEQHRGNLETLSNFNATNNLILQKCMNKHTQVSRSQR